MSKPVKARKGSSKPTKGTKATNGKPAAVAATKATTSDAVKAARPGSKLELIIGMMKAAKGCTLAEMAKATKWKPAAVRGVIYNVVKGRLGLTVTLTPNEERGTVFNIVNGNGK
jgi:Protein of unknown function (DUF3489)